MSKFTYEKTDRNEIYERWEWDDLWIENPADSSMRRVLYIGDSISCGTRRVATALANEKIFFDGFGTSKGIDNPYFKDAIRLFAKQEGKRDAVIFNNGLHGWHLNDNEQYKHHFEEMIKYLLTEFKDTPVFVVLTTHIGDEREKRVIVRNNVAIDIANKYNLPVIDLYNPSLESSELLLEDQIHFTSDGYKMLANKILQSIAKVITDADI